MNVVPVFWKLLFAHSIEGIMVMNESVPLPVTDGIFLASKTRIAKHVAK